MGTYLYSWENIVRSWSCNVLDDKIFGNTALYLCPSYALSLHKLCFFSFFPHLYLTVHCLRSVVTAVLLLSCPTYRNTHRKQTLQGKCSTIWGPAGLLIYPLLLTSVQVPDSKGLQFLFSKNELSYFKESTNNLAKNHVDSVFTAMTGWRSCGKEYAENDAEGKWGAGRQWNINR